MTTVVVADDHAPTRLAVRIALEEAGFEVVGEAADAKSAVEVTRETKPAVALLDVHMPGNGVTAAREIARDIAGTIVVMLTVSRDDTDLFDAVRAGAVGYLLKDIDPDRLPNALRGVLDGEAALPRSLVLRLMAEFRGRDERRLGRSRGKRLTEREWQVLRLLAHGSSTTEIAGELFVEPVTVRTYVSAILHKLDVPDRASAVRLYRDWR